MHRISTSSIGEVTRHRDIDGDFPFAFECMVGLRGCRGLSFPVADWQDFPGVGRRISEIAGCFCSEVHLTAEARESLIFKPQINAD
jgi:hypothetical protein